MKHYEWVTNKAALTCDVENMKNKNGMLTIFSYVTNYVYL